MLCWIFSLTNKFKMHPHPLIITSLFGSIFQMIAKKACKNEIIPNHVPPISALQHKVLYSCLITGKPSMNQRNYILSSGSQYQDCSNYQVNDKRSRGGNRGYTCRASWTHEKWQQLSSNPVSPFPSSTGCQTQECRTNSLSFPVLTHLHPFIWTADWKELQPSTGS